MGPSAVSAKPALEREAPALPPAKGRPLCVRKTVAALLASALLVGGGGVLVAFLAQREFVVEHVAELWGIPYESSLEHPGSDYSRMLTPVLEGLFRSSFQNSSLEGRCARCSVLQYRRGNASVLVRLHLWFSTEPPSPAQEEEALSRGLVATLGGQGISLATYGTLSSISLAGSFSPSGMARKSGRCPGSAFPCRSGQCVAVQNAECNDRRDCADGSDEAECDCGARPALQASSRIVGGSQASRGEFPWQVSLRENHEHFCGATILSARWLVSAAHCFNEFQDPGSWTAHAGSVWLSGGGEGVGAKAGVARILRHPSYDTDTADYDIALLELAEPLAFSKYVQPVCLPAASHAFPVGRKCLISGWGYLKEDFLIKPELLQKATVELLDQALCTTLYKNALTARMVCAGYLEGKVDSCQGDSGGPLVCEETSGRFFLAGITSWGIGCAEARRPGVYTRVTKLRDWILHTMAAPPAQPGLSRPTLSWPVASTTVVGGKLRPTVATDRPAATMAWPQECGRRPGFAKPNKIVGGVDASRGEIPWQVSLQEGLQHFCGATIIGERWLLSTAHCFNHSTKAERLVAFAGITSLAAAETSSVKASVKRVVAHPAYDPARLDFDVALLELSRPLTFGKYVQPLCLPLAVHKFPAGQKCLISGWGSVREGNASKPENLQRASVGILDQKTCNALYNFSLTERMLCAGFLEGQVDSCQGDSGGPLACEETPGVFYLAGLVSWGLGCAQAKRPGVYTRITKLKGWIVDAMASLRPGTVPGSLVGALPASSSTPATSSAPAFSQPSASQGMTWPLLSSSLRAGASLSRMTAGFSRAPLLPGVPCSPSTFKCSSKVCIGKVNPECDGIPDCSNGKDEADCDCGLTPATAFSKIVGGSGAARGEWPWQVSLWLRRKEHKCGAVVIAERWLLSAAHCFDRYSNPKLWVAVLGTPSLSGLDGQVETVARILRHPFYNAYTLDYDMALLELASPLRYSRAVKPICLPDGTHRFPAGSPCFITGWGSTKEGGPTSKHLQKAAVKLLAEADCRRFYPVQISSRMLCAGFPQGAVDSCSGDAGGPLACREPSGRWFLAGITSWGYGCARPFFPGVYAKVTAVRGWIGQNLKE
uniref:Transmembrane protease serine 9 isoform X1 n=1 Tax=Pogona vitticeps TaxID=103695 RepID=A0ABM5EMD8_9SAUR